MKRSELNQIMKNAVEFIGEHKFLLPPFAFFSVEDWQTKGHDYDEIRDNMLGWRANRQRNVRADRGGCGAYHGDHIFTDRISHSEQVEGKRGRKRIFGLYRKEDKIK